MGEGPANVSFYLSLVVSVVTFRTLEQIVIEFAHLLEFGTFVGRSLLQPVKGQRTGTSRSVQGQRTVAVELLRSKRVVLDFLLRTRLILIEQILELPQEGSPYLWMLYPNGVILRRLRPVLVFQRYLPLLYEKGSPGLPRDNLFIHRNAQSCYLFLLSAIPLLELIQVDDRIVMHIYGGFLLFYEVGIVFLLPGFG